MKRWKDWKFKTKLLIIISMFTGGLIAAVSLLNYRWHSAQITSQTIVQTQQIIDQTGENINRYMDELFRLTLSPYYNEQIIEELETLGINARNTLEKKRKIENFLESVMILPRDDILRVYIVNEEGIYSFKRVPYDMEEIDNYEQTEWYQRAMETTNPVFIPAKSEKVYGEKQMQIFSITRKLRSMSQNDKTVGLIKVDADYSGIKSLCDKIELEEDSGLFVINEENEVVYEQGELREEQLSDGIVEFQNINNFETNMNGKKYVVNISGDSSQALRVITVNSYEQIIKSARRNLHKTILLTIICMIITVAVVYLFIRRFFAPLFRIIECMSVVQTGDISVQAKVDCNDEIGYLAHSFNVMIRQLGTIMKSNTELVREVYETKYLQKESQYQALYNQIKPHFLYNTLNTISLLIKCGERKKAVSCIENLSYFMRGIMHTDKDITLKTELRIISAYLDIQQLRYGEHLSYNISADKSLEEIKIPALTLQPLVENAVKHGCEKVKDNCHIDIDIREEKERYLLSVEDNSKGIDRAALDKLNRKLNTMKDNVEVTEALEGGIGLGNVHRRVRLKFGDDSGLCIQSEERKGTKVTIHIYKQHV